MKKNFYIIIFCLLVLTCGIEIKLLIRVHNEPEVINDTYVPPPLQLRLQSDVTGRGMVVDTEVVFEKPGKIFLMSIIATDSLGKKTDEMDYFYAWPLSTLHSEIMIENDTLK